MIYDTNLIALVPTQTQFQINQILKMTK